MADMIHTVAKCGGAIVIPPSAVGLAQTLMYFPRELEQNQGIPHLPVYVDSILAITSPAFARAITRFTTWNYCTKSKSAMATGSAFAKRG